MGGFPGGTVVKNLPANAGDAGSIPVSGRSLKEEMAIHSSILAWKMPWMEELGRLQPMGCFLKWGNLKTLIKKLQMIKQMERYAVLMDWEN